MELLDKAGGLNRFLPFPLRRKPSWRERISSLLRFPLKTRRRRWFLFTTLLILFLSIALLTIGSVYLFFQVRGLPVLGRELNEAVGSRDLGRIEASLGAVDSQLGKVGTAFSSMFVLRAVPWIGDYYRDGTHALRAVRLAIDTGGQIVRALIPYRESLGLGEGFGSQITVEQRMANLMGTLPEIADELEDVWENFLTIKGELGAIDPQRYPEEVRGVKVRFWLEEAQKILTETEPLVRQGRALLELAPKFLGSPKTKTYLVAFQNDAEVRSTGGLVTAVSLLSLADGLVKKNIVYSATKLPPSPSFEKPPAPMAKYLGISRWKFHDGNYSPDFPTSSKKLLQMWKRAGLPKVSGVIAINTESASQLLKITGPLEIPPYNWDLSGSYLPELCQSGGKYFTSKNLVCRLEFYVEKDPLRISRRIGRNQAKAEIMRKLSDAVIQKVSSSSAEIWPKLVDLVFDLLIQRDIMIYSSNAVEQALIENLGYSGSIQSFEGDYLHISENNYGGLKTDMFMTATVKQELTKREDGTWRKKVSITYFNPQKYDNWLSGGYRDFVRIYVPEGSQLVAVSGASAIWTSPNKSAKMVADPSGWGEFGKTVFGAFFTVSPQKEKVLTFVYDLPSSITEAMEDSGEYRLFLQKQSGTNIGLVKVQIGATIESVDLSQDREITIPLGR